MKITNKINKLTSSINLQEKTDLYIGNGIIDKINQILKPYNHTSFVILCDKTTEKLFGLKIKNLLLKLKVPVFLYAIENGEKSKNIENIISILKFLLANNLDRKSALIALGGGVTGDIATVACGLYYRGIDCIQVPTTLLSMADSSMGGKGAVNLDLQKNIIGLIRQPRIIITDPLFLKSLPKNQIKSGMAEIIKHAISMDLLLFEELEKAENLNGQIINLEILHSIKLKMNIVKIDPLDLEGKREILNFGHTLGNNIELLTTLSHGEAVSVGMVFAIKLSQKVNLLKDVEVNRLLSLIKKYGLPTYVLKLNIEEVLKQILKDKKTIEKIPRFVLLNKIGSAVTQQVVPVNIIKEVLKEIIL